MIGHHRRLPVFTWDHKDGHVLVAFKFGGEGLTKAIS